MSDEFAVHDAPLLYGLGSDGKMHHVDSVARGKACGCICPSPDCAHPLIARQGDVKLHSFAHAPGATCDWGVEAMLAQRAYAWLTRCGFFMFPALDYERIEPRFFNEFWFEHIRTHTEGEGAIRYETVPLSDSAAVRVSGVSLVKMSGRVAPELYLSVDGREDSKCYIVVIVFSHKLAYEQMSRLSSCCDGVIVCDFSRERKRLIKERSSEEGRHFDRSEVLLECQSDDMLKSLLFDAPPSVYWAYHPLVSSLEKEDAIAWRKAYLVYCEELKRTRAEEKARQEKMRAEHDRRVREEARARSEAYFAEMTSPARVAKALMEEKRRAYEQKMIAARRAYDLFDAHIIENDRALAYEHADLRREFQRAEDERAAAERVAMLSSRLDSTETIARDESGARIIRCKVCGHVGHEDDFISYGGASINQGTCRECYYA